MVQKFAKVKYDKTVLQQIYNHYMLRVKYRGDKAVAKQLDDAYRAFAALKPERAQELMQGL